MSELLVICGAQKDFFQEPFGNPKAVKILPKMIEYVNAWDGDIIAVKETRFTAKTCSRTEAHLFQHGTTVVNISRSDIQSIASSSLRDGIFFRGCSKRYRARTRQDANLEL